MLIFKEYDSFEEEREEEHKKKMVDELSLIYIEDLHVGTFFEYPMAAPFIDSYKPKRIY